MYIPNAGGLAAKPRDVFWQKPALPHPYLCRDIITNKAPVHNTILIQRTQLPKMSKYRPPKLTYMGLRPNCGQLFFPPKTKHGLNFNFRYVYILYCTLRERQKNSPPLFRGLDLDLNIHRFDPEFRMAHGFDGITTSRCTKIILTYLLSSSSLLD